MLAEEPASPQRFDDFVAGGQLHEAGQVVAAMLAEGWRPSAIVRDVLAPTQVRVGERWQRAAWTVADEHRATAVVDDVLGVLSVAVPPRSDRPAVALVCAEGEWHVTPARMAALVLREAGVNVTFLGGSMPAVHLRAHLSEARAGVVAVSCSLPLVLPGAAATVAAAHQLDLPVVVGGRAFDAAGVRAAAVGADAQARTVDDAVPVLERWFDRPPALRDPVRAPDGDEHLTLELHVRDLVRASLDALRDRFPAMRAYDEERLARTREDLAHIVDHTRVALWAGDPSLLTEMVDWLEEVLEARGVPAAALDAGIAAIVSAMGGGWPRATALLSGILSARGTSSGRGER